MRAILITLIIMCPIIVGMFYLDTHSIDKAAQLTALLYAIAFPVCRMFNKLVYTGKIL